MNYHPDDQAEIDRLHSEFIAVDEPNNEQVMAFQDASYALGLKRGQAHEAALQQRLNEADHRIDEARQVLSRASRFADSVANAVHRHGSYTPLHWQEMDGVQRDLSQLTKDSPEVGS